MEHKYKVGDKVFLGLEIKQVTTESPVLMYFGQTYHGLGGWFFPDDIAGLAADLPAPSAPVIPADWAPISDPPMSDRNMLVQKYNDKERVGFFLPSKNAWFVVRKDGSARLARPGELIAWREIE